MQAIIRDFEERIQEIDGYIKFVWIITSINKIDSLAAIQSQTILSTNKVKAKYKLGKLLHNESFLIDVELQRTLKASCFLILYNAVESTITESVNYFFEAFSNEKLPYKKVQDEIKRIWIKYNYSGFKSFKNKNGEKEDEYVVRVINTIFADIIEVSPNATTMSLYKSYLQKVGNKSEISGNLDAKQIRDIMNLYGIPLPKKDKCNCLVTVKNKRNSLAHGEESFKEVGRSFTIEEIMTYKDEMYHYMNGVLKQFDKHIKNKKFKKSK